MADNIDKMIAKMRAAAPAGHPMHTADYADLRIAVASLAERKQLELATDK